MAVLPEKRQAPFRIGVDHDMGAYIEDVYCRLVAAFGYHPNGEAATDEAQFFCDAANSASRVTGA